YTGSCCDPVRDPSSLFFFFLTPPPPPNPTLFPYTTLFRSRHRRDPFRCCYIYWQGPDPCQGHMEARRPTTLPHNSSVSTSRSLRSEEHTSELQSQSNLVCRLLLEKKKKNQRSKKHSYTETR